MHSRRSAPTKLLPLTFFFFAASACSGKDPDLGNVVTENPCDIPVDSLSEMKAWVEAEEYVDWPSEPEPHSSAGPHFGNVRTWLSPELEESLLGGRDSHPLCSAAVKELYGSGSNRRGWAASVKVGETGTASDWYWFEVYDGETIAAGTDIDLCTGCHGSGSDSVRTTVPLTPL